MKTREGYMCATDFDFELGVNMTGPDTYPKIYPSLEEIKRHRKCVEECGIVKVKIEFMETVEKGEMYEH